MADTYVCMFAKLTDIDSAQFSQPGDGGLALSNLEAFVREIKTNPKARLGYTVIDDSGTEPNGTITVVAATVLAGDTITFDFQGGSVVLTAGTDFDIDTTDNNNQAALLQAGMAEHKVLRTLVEPTVATNVVTVTAPFPGPCLEGIDMATSNAVAFTLVQIGAGVAGVEGVAEHFFVGKSEHVGG